MGKLMRINMTDLSVTYEELPEAYKELGGRGLTSTIIHDEVDPLCHALGPNNKLVFGLGYVTGSAAPTSARVSVGGKSPLTGGIKEANAGSGWAPALADFGVKALIIRASPRRRASSGWRT
jgi:aldehyde:ferredoxin oxidoreductase